MGFGSWRAIDSPLHEITQYLVGGHATRRSRYHAASALLLIDISISRVITKIQTKKAPAAIQNASNPFHANGPVRTK
jgi:hypothetical protein